MTMVKEIDLIVRGAQLVTSGVPAEADLYVYGGKVVGVGRLDLSSKEVVEGKGLFLLPKCSRWERRTEYRSWLMPLRRCTRLS